MININFSYNWNNKLDCKAFTTIRIYSVVKHIPGQEVNIQLGGADLCEGKIIEVKRFFLKDMTNYMAYLDTGYDKEEATKIITRMYPRFDFTKQMLAFILILKNKQ